MMGCFESASYSIRAANIILQGHNRMRLNSRLEHEHEHAVVLQGRISIER